MTDDGTTRHRTAGAAAASDENSPSSKQGAAAALQLLQLAATTKKRPRSDTATNNHGGSRDDQAPEGQFDDAGEDELLTTDNKRSKALGTGHASWFAPPQQLGLFNPYLYNDGGQFSDAEEGEEDNIPVPWGDNVPQQHSLPPPMPPAGIPLPSTATLIPQQYSTTPSTSHLPLLAPLPPGAPRNLGISDLPNPPSSTTVFTHGPQQRTFADGPLLQHPNPVLEPDSNIPHAERLPVGSVIPSDTETRQFPIYLPLPTDIVLGRGGGPNRHAGNMWFRDFIQAYRGTYHRVDKYMKKQLAVNLVHYIRHCGGRFLEKKSLGSGGGGVSVWYEVGDGRARSKCSQALREPIGEIKLSSSSTTSKSTKSTSSQKKQTMAAAVNQKQRRPSASSTITSQHSYEALDDDNDNDSTILEI